MNRPIPYITVRCAPARVAHVQDAWDALGAPEQIVFTVRAYEGANAYRIAPIVYHNLGASDKDIISKLLLAGKTE